MSCRLDVKKAIIEDTLNRFVKGRHSYNILPDNTIEIAGTVDNTLTRAKKRSQAEAIASNLSRRIGEFYNNHVMGTVLSTSTYEPVLVFLNVSDSYIESEYRKLPKEKQTDPADIELPEEYKKILEENKGKLDGLSRMLMEGNPIEFLKYIAEQSYGISGSETASYEQGAQFTVKPILDVAQAMFPRSSFVKPDDLPPIEEC